MVGGHGGRGIAIGGHGERYIAASADSGHAQPRRNIFHLPSAAETLPSHLTVCLPQVDHLILQSAGRRSGVATEQQGGQGGEGQKSLHTPQDAAFFLMEDEAVGGSGGGSQGRCCWSAWRSLLWWALSKHRLLHFSLTALHFLWSRRPDVLNSALFMEPPSSGSLKTPGEFRPMVAFFTVAYDQFASDRRHVRLNRVGSRAVADRWGAQVESAAT